MDCLAFIGRNPGDHPNVYIATGDTGMGMTHGTIAGILLTDLIAGRPNPWTTLYDPARVALRASMDFVTENVNTAAHYADWVTSGQVDSADEIEAGAGALIRRGVSKVAVYRDEEGRLHERSAVCPHLGCIVAWNSLEKTWDCPVTARASTRAAASSTGRRIATCPRRTARNFYLPVLRTLAASLSGTSPATAESGAIA